MVSLDHMVKRYDDFCLDISMEIPDGMITGIIGKNGAGKSTTIKAILGLVRPDEGRVMIQGKEAGTLSLKDKQKIGVALSDSGFSNYLNVEDIICILRKMYDHFDEKLFREECRNQNLPMKKMVKDFSTGMKARLRVIAAITHQAELLILDEPTSGLDVEARMEILDMLRRYMEEDEQRSILITSHISSDLEGLCDDIYLIHEGKVILHEETDRILDHYAVLKVSRETYEKMDKRYLLQIKMNEFGCTCFTDQKQYYAENYPGIVIENGNVDDLILMMAGGK